MTRVVSGLLGGPDPTLITKGTSLGAGRDNVIGTGTRELPVLPPVTDTAPRLMVGWAASSLTIVAVPVPSGAVVAASVRSTANVSSGSNDASPTVGTENVAAIAPAAMVALPERLP